MHALNLRLTVLGVLFMCTLAACNKPISTAPVGRGIDGSVAKVGDQLYQAAETMRTQTDQSADPVVDAAMNKQVKLAILAEFGLRVLEMNVETVDQMVTLTGTIDSQANSNKAMQIARAVAGVKLVENRLIVRPLKWS